MPKSYTNLLYHIVFSTRERRPLITAERRPRLYEYIGGTIRDLGGISLAIGGGSRYIANQERHHAKRSFREEFIEMLRVNEIGFDEKFLWR